MNLAQTIKDFRVFSIGVTLFTCTCLSELLTWIYTSINLEEVSTQEGLIITSVLASVVALVKFSFSFAMEASVVKGQDDIDQHKK